MNCGLRHFGNDVMQLSYRHMSIGMNVSFNSVKKVIRDQRWPTALLFIVNISPSFGEFTAPLCHSLPTHNITISSNNLFVNFCWTFIFALRNCMTECTSHLAGLLDQCCHFKHVSFKQSWFCHCQTSMAHR